MDIAALAAELATGHPATGAYSADNAAAADELNAVNRPEKVSISQLLNFLMLENTHKTDGTDTQDRAIWTRLQDVAAMAVTPTGAEANPWGSTAIGTITEIQQIKTKQLLNFFEISGQGNLAVNLDLTDSSFNVMLSGAVSAGCLSATQRTALLALADNLQSRAQEIGLGKVKEGHVQAART